MASENENYGNNTNFMEGSYLINFDENLFGNEFLDPTQMETPYLIGELHFDNQLHYQKTLDLPKVITPPRVEIPDLHALDVHAENGGDDRNVAVVDMDHIPEGEKRTTEASGSNEHEAFEQSTSIFPNLQMKKIFEEERVESPREDGDARMLLSTIAETTTLSTEVVTPPSQESATEIPVVIVLERKHVCKRTQIEALEYSCSGAVGVPEHLSFKLPKRYQDISGLSIGKQQSVQGKDNISAGNEVEHKVITLSEVINFKLPSEIHRSIEVMDEKLPVTSDSPSLSERLEGWIIRQEITQKNGHKRNDKMFKNQKTGKICRSFLEAETYIVYAGRTQHLSSKRKQREVHSEKKQSQAAQSETFHSTSPENLQHPPGVKRRRGSGYLRVSSPEVYRARLENLLRSDEDTEDDDV